MDSNKSYTSVILSDSNVLGKVRKQLFVYFPIVFSVYTALPIQRSMSSNPFVFQTSRRILSRPTVFVFFVVFLFVCFFLAFIF